MHLFGPRLLFLPLLFGFGVLKLLLIIAVVVLFVRVVTTRHGHPVHAHHAHWSPVGDDPRRVAAMRYASGRISREEYERIVRDLDATTPAPPAPPVA